MSNWHINTCQREWLPFSFPLASNALRNFAWLDTIFPQEACCLMLKGTMSQTTKYELCDSLKKTKEDADQEF